MTQKVVSVALQARVDGFVAGMRKAKSATDDLTKSSNKMSKQDAFASVANKAAIAGVGVATAVGVAVKRFADFDQAMSAVKANTGAAGAELESLRNAAVTMGADSVFSAKEAADGINELGKAGISTADILGGGLKGSLDLAAAGQIGVAQAAETTASALSQFKLGGDQAVHVADLLTNGANKAQGGVGDLGAALNQTGLVAAQTGLSIEETAAGLTAFAKAGLIGSDAGTSMKTMLMRLTPESDAAAAAMEEIGLKAYDSAGNFIGLEAVAGQLKAGLSNLSQEQQAATLKTIFGADAVRAASILYTEGAEGIAKWTDEVTEQGAAAKQAATLTDNLKGDVERLGGALDSVFISTGSGANSGLRTLTQGITGLVEQVGKIPGPLLLAGGGLTAFALLAPKGVMAYRDYAATLDTLGLSMDKISAKSPRAGAALKSLHVAGLATAAVMAEAQALDLLGRKLAELQGIRPVGLESAKSEILAGGDAADAFSAALSKSTGEASKLDSSFKNLILPTRLFGGGMEATKESVKSYDAALADLVTSGNGQQAAAFLERAGVSAEMAARTLPAYSESLKGAANESKLAGTASSGLSDNLKAVEASAEAASDEVDDYLKSLVDAGLVVLSTRSAQRDLAAAIDEAAAAATEATKAGVKQKDMLDITTEAGRKNQASLDGVADSALSLAQAVYEETGSEAAFRASLVQSRASLEATARKFIKSEADVQKFVNSVLKVPPVKRTNITTTAPAAKAQVDALQRSINALRGNDVTITTRYVDVGRPSAGGGRNTAGGITKATGGAVYGPGTGTSDSIPARLSNGEHVLTAAEVRAMGGQSAVYAMRAAIRQGNVPKFADGGAVASMSRFASPSVSSPVVRVTSQATDLAPLQSSIAALGADIRQMRFEIDGQTAGRVVTKYQRRARENGGR